MSRAEYLDAKWQEFLDEIKRVDEENKLHEYYENQMKTGKEVITPDGRKIILHKVAK